MKITAVDVRKGGRSPGANQDKGQERTACHRAQEMAIHPPGQDILGLRKNGLIPLQEDGTPWSGMLMGAKECGPDAIDQQAHFPLAIMSDNDTGNWSMTNAGVHLSWCLLNTNPRSYEIVVYMG